MKHVKLTKGDTIEYDGNWYLVKAGSFFRLEFTPLYKESKLVEENAAPNSPMDQFSFHVTPEDVQRHLELIGEENSDDDAAPNAPGTRENVLRSPPPMGPDNTGSRIPPDGDGKAAEPTRPCIGCIDNCNDGCGIAWKCDCGQNNKPRNVTCVKCKKERDTNE